MTWTTPDFSLSSQPAAEPVEQRRLWLEAARQRQATALAHPNIAFIKYWGNQDDELRLPANASLSMNLESLYTKTTVRFEEGLAGDRLVINGTPVIGTGLARVSASLDLTRAEAGLQQAASVESHSNFPVGSGIASSAHWRFLAMTFNPL